MNRQPPDSHDPEPPPLDVVGYRRSRRRGDRAAVVLPAVLSVLLVLLGVADVVDAVRGDESFGGGLLYLGLAVALASRPRSDTRGGFVLWLVPILCLAGVQVTAFLGVAFLAL